MKNIVEKKFCLIDSFLHIFLGPEDVDKQLIRLKANNNRSVSRKLGLAVEYMAGIRPA